MRLFAGICVGVLVAAGCTDDSKDRCSSAGDCLAGYICSDEGRCVSVNSSTSSGSGGLVSSGGSSGVVGSSSRASSSSRAPSSGGGSSALVSSSAGASSTTTVSSSMVASSSSSGVGSSSAAQQSSSNAVVSSSAAAQSSSDGVGSSSGAGSSGQGGSSSGGNVSGDRCDNALLLDLSSGVASVTSTLSGLGNEYVEGCEPGASTLDGPDAFYTLVLGEPRVVSVTVDTTVGSSETGLVLLNGACAGTTTLAACTSDRLQNGTAALSPRVLSAGTYTLVVDSRNATAGGYGLTVTSDPVPDGELCSGAIPYDVTFQDVVLTGNLLGHTDDASTGCEAGQLALNGPELFYSLHLDEPRVLTFQLDTAATNRELALTTFSGACAGRTLTACSSDLDRNGMARLTPRIYAAGTHLFAVDARYTPSADAAFTATVQSSPVPAGATCDRALPLDVSSGSGMLTGDLAAHTADSAAGCEVAQNPFYGPDVFYAFTLSQPATLQATLSTTALNQELGMVLWSGACGSLQQLTCDSDLLRAGDASISRALTAGSYVLAIESRSSGAAMPFTVSYSLTP